MNQDLLSSDGTGSMDGTGEIGNAPEPMPGYTPPALMPINGARAPMVQALLTSPEYFTNRIQSDYQKFLRRDATPAELGQWLGTLQNGGSPADVAMGILTSDEYFNRAGGTTTGFMSRLSQDLLGT